MGLEYIPPPPPPRIPPIVLERARQQVAAIPLLEREELWILAGGNELFSEFPEAEAERRARAGTVPWEVMSSSAFAQRLRNVYTTVSK